MHVAKLCPLSPNVTERRKFSHSILLPGLFYEAACKISESLFVFVINSPVNLNRDTALKMFSPVVLRFLLAVWLKARQNR